MTYQNPPPLTFHADRLRDRVIFVTGASSGIGAAACRLFAAEGAKVVAAARREDRINQIVDELKGQAKAAAAVVCDVRNEESVASAVRFALETFGRLDGAFNNAGFGGGHAPMHQADTGIFDHIMAVNLRGVFLCLKHEIAAMLDSGGGAIVNTSSIGGLVGGAQNGMYAASKWGLAGLTKCAALDYARLNIRVNAIAPGPTRSEMFDRWMPTEEHRAALAERTPMNYVAHPEDMARAALFLLSDEARWTTGTVFPCEGGISAG